MKKIIILSAMIACVCAFAADILTIKITPDQQNYFITPQKSGTYWVISSAKSRIAPGQQHMADIRLDNGPLLTRRLLAYNRTEANAHFSRWKKIQVLL